MAQDTAETIHLYRVSTMSDKPCLDILCRSWSDAPDDFTCRLIHASDIEQGFEQLLTRTGRDCSSLESCDVYLCAPEERIREFGPALERRPGASDERLTIEPVRCVQEKNLY
jgi:hypothetical protein